MNPKEAWTITAACLALPLIGYYVGRNSNVHEDCALTMRKQHASQSLQEKAAQDKCSVPQWTQSLIDTKFKEGCSTVFGENTTDQFVITYSMTKKP